MPVRPGVGVSPEDSTSVVMQIADIAGGPGRAVERAEALLDRLHRVVPFDASFIALLHPERREHLPLVRSGYDERTRAFLDSPAWMDDIEALGMQRERRPTRACDLTVPPEEVRCWAGYLVPAGFREGLGVGLFRPDGRYLGMLGMHTASPVPPTDDARDLIGMLAPLIAHAVDPMRSASAVAGVVHDAVAAVVVTRDATALALPGLPAHRLLATGSAVLQVVSERLAAGGVHAAFLCPDGDDGYLRVTVMSAPPEPPYHFAAVVTVSPAGDRQGLTHRELEVLGLLVEGWPNHAIALGLGITDRTVAAHVEHVLTKLAVTSRTMAAVYALRLGLFVPWLLHGARVADDEP